jgi:hypothetical protein
MCSVLLRYHHPSVAWYKCISSFVTIVYTCVYSLCGEWWTFSAKYFFPLAISLSA